MYTLSFFFTPLPISGHLGCLYLLAIVNHAAMDVQISLHIPAFFFCIGSQKWFAGACSNSMFNFFEESPYYFPQGLYHLILALAKYKVLISIQPCQYLLVSIFYLLLVWPESLCRFSLSSYGKTQSKFQPAHILVILMGGKQYLIVVLVLLFLNHQWC